MKSCGGRTLALQRGCGPGTRRSAARFAGWLWPCVKPLHSVHCEGAARRGAVPWRLFPSPHPKSYGLCRLICLGFSLCAFQVCLDVDLSQEPVSTALGASGSAQLFLLSENPLLCREELSPVCCQAPQHSGEGSWRAAHPGSDAGESWAQQVGGWPRDPGPTHSRADGGTEASGTGWRFPAVSPGEDLGFGLIPGRGDRTWSRDQVSPHRPPSRRDVWERDGAELVQNGSERLGACWGRGLIQWHLLVLVPLGKEPTLTSHPMGWVCTGGCAESPRGHHVIS